MPLLDIEWFISFLYLSVSSDVISVEWCGVAPHHIQHDMLIYALAWHGMAPDRTGPLFTKRGIKYH